MKVKYYLGEVPKKLTQIDMNNCKTLKEFLDKEYPDIIGIEEV
jgi:hypothetical protein